MAKGKSPATLVGRRQLLLRTAIMVSLVGLSGVFIKGGAVAQTKISDDSTVQTAYKNVTPCHARVNSRDSHNSSDRVYRFTGCTTGAVSGKELMLRLAADSSHAVASYNLMLDLSAGAPTCIGVSHGGVNEESLDTGPGGRTPPGGRSGGV